MGRESAEILKDPARLDALWRSSLLDTPAGLLQALCHEVTSAGTVAAAVERATADD